LLGRPARTVATAAAADVVATAAATAIAAATAATAAGAAVATAAVAAAAQRVRQLYHACSPNHMQATHQRVDGLILARLDAAPEAAVLRRPNVPR